MFVSHKSDYAIDLNLFQHFKKRHFLKICDQSYNNYSLIYALKTEEEN